MLFKAISPTDSFGITILKDGFNPSKVSQKYKNVSCPSPDYVQDILIME
jgi:hypothetical protein